MTIDTTDTELPRLKAERLVQALNGLGLAAQTYWDRGPYCAQVFLTSDHDEFAPSLMVYVENTASCHIIAPGTGKAIGWRWQSQISGVSDEFDDVSVEFLERTWLWDDEHKVAELIAKFVGIIDVSELTPA